MLFRKLGATLVLCVAIACSGGSSGGGGGISVDLVAAFASLVFDRPVDLVQHPDDPDRWYVVEQGGSIWTFLESDPVGTLTLALDLSLTVNLGAVTGGGEQGLLGLALDPDFDAITGGEAYLSYTDEDTDQSILARYESIDGGLSFTPLTVPVLAVPHPLSNHNGGDLEWGANGDFLFWSLGDGGGSGDPAENGQNPSTLLGSILRLDVRGVPPMGQAYGIPPGNPFAGNPQCASGSGAIPCPEVWAYGFRNPWRIGVDPLTGDLWAGDVGESTLEEIDFVIAGRNYGWDCREGDMDFEFVPPCSLPALTEPEAVHPRPEAQSITGGRVYRGTDVFSLVGFYVYGDFVTGNFWALDTVTFSPPIPLALPAVSVSAFGQGADGEVYVVTFDSPSIYKIQPGP